MSLKRLSGKEFDINVGDALVHVETASLKINDGRKVRMTKGVPDGYLDGETTADGDLVVNHENFLLIQAQAASAGSWKGLDPVDVSFMAKVTTGEKRVEAYGCLLKLDEVINIDAKGGETDKTKIPFEITDKRFVSINGIPYLAPDEIQGIS